MTTGLSCGHSTGCGAGLGPRKERWTVLLVYPPSRTQDHTSCPAGLMMLGAVLEGAGHEVHLLDANAVCNRRTVEQIVQHAGRLQPDVIGVTLVTPLVKEAYRLAAALRDTGAKLLAGGPHATILPEEPLAHGFDAVVVGEGELTVEPAVRSLMGLLPGEEVEGWVYRDEQGSIRHTRPRAVLAELDALPIPARHLVRAADYGDDDNPSLHTSLFTSRGCPAKCAYCSGSLFGKRFRFRSARHILDEMSAIHARYGTRHFHFVDDAMTANRQRVHEICDGLRASGLGLTWSMMTRVDFVDEDLLAAVAGAGCTQIDFGIESGHAETLRRIHKPHTVEMVKRLIPLTASKGIKPYVFFILGFPWDTVESIASTRRLMEELAPFVACFHPAIASILIPFPGTEIYGRYKEEFGFEGWWLRADRNFDAPDGMRCSYFESQLFARGAVLDADFFAYSPNVRRKIFGVFTYMWRHNLRQHSWRVRMVKRLLFETSRAMSRLSPSLERAAFASAKKMKRLSSIVRSLRRECDLASPAADLHGREATPK